jgi:hypothetical protein
MDIAEGSLAELIDDPLIGLVMKSDGVDRRELELLLQRVTRERSRTPSSGLLITKTAPCSHP